MSNIKLTYNREKIKSIYKDISYFSASNSQKLDIYLPNQGTKPYPALFHIHGGAFKMCDKADNQVDPFLHGLDQGYAIISANYRLSGEAIFPAGLIDLKAAIRFIKANAYIYDIDINNIICVGGSAGGYYTLMLCTTNGVSEFEDLSMGNKEYSSKVKAGVAWFPPTDFLLMDEQLKINNLEPQDHNFKDSPESEFLGGQITELPYDYVQKSNPISYISSNMPPIFLQHGKIDHIVPYQQSQIFVNKVCEKVGKDKIFYEILDEADHADALFETTENMKKVFNFINKVAKS